MKQDRVTSSVYSTSASQVVHDYRMQVFARLSEDYGLAIKPDWQVFPVDDRGLDFVGSVFRSSGTRLRKGIARGVRDKAHNIRYNHRKMNPCQIANGAGSYWGWCKHGGAKALWHQHMRADVKKHIAASKAKIQEAQRCK